MPNSEICSRFQNASKVLYMSHVAIGDYLYQRSFLRQIKRRFPHLQLDIWFDDFRTHSKPWQASRAKMLSEWMKADGIYHNIYSLCASQLERKAQLCQAYEEGYDGVLFIANIRQRHYAHYARKIAGNGFTLGTSSACSRFEWRSKIAFTRLTHHFYDSDISQSNNILDLYCARFSALAGTQFEPNLAALELMSSDTQLIASKLRQWHSERLTATTVVINVKSTSSKRDYDLATMFSIIEKLHGCFCSTLFVLNTTPELLAEYHRAKSNFDPKNEIPVQCFTAENGVFELFALVQQAQLVVSVDTALVHVAAAFDTPLVALFREQNRHWCPVNDNTTALFTSGVVSDIQPTRIYTAVERQLAKISC